MLVNLCCKFVKFDIFIMIMLRKQNICNLVSLIVHVDTYDSLFKKTKVCLQCFDTVRWAAGRVSDL